MKKLFNVLFTISILFLIIIITIRFNIVESFFYSFVENKISDYFILEIRQSLSDLDENTKTLIIEKFISSKEFEEINKKIYENVIIDLKNNTISEFNISNELNNLINKIPLNYREFAGEIVSTIDFNNIYRNLLLGIKSKIGIRYLSVFNIYDKVTNDSVISLLCIIILLSLVIILIKNKSIISTLNDIGLSLFIDGGIMIVFLVFLKKIEISLSMLQFSKIDLSLFEFLTFSFLVIGLILKDIKIKKRN